MKYQLECAGYLRPKQHQYLVDGDAIVAIIKVAGGGLQLFSFNWWDLESMVGQSRLVFGGVAGCISRHASQMGGPKEGR